MIASHHAARARHPALGTLLALSLLAALALAVVVGPGGVAPRDALQLIARRLVGAGPPTDPDVALVDAIVWSLRLPRALLAALVGAALGVAGGLTQGLFRNPMAEPGVIGVSAGAAAAAILGFTLGLDGYGLWVTPALAAAGALGVMALLLALVDIRAGTTTLLLAGIAIAAMCSSLSTLLLALVAERWDLGLKVVRWLMGSFEGRSWEHLAGGVAPITLGLVFALWLGRDLDTMQLGDDTARSLGVRTGRFRQLVILCTAVLVGAATAVCGVIGFVGLVVPHIVRLLVGPGHRRLLPLSALLGASLVVLVDTAARAVTRFSLPPGVVTSLLGAPFFLWLLRRRSGGGV